MRLRAHTSGSPTIASWTRNPRISLRTALRTRLSYSTTTTKDGKTGKLLIGDDSPTGTGVFAKLDNDPRVFLVATTTKTNINKSPTDLRDKRLLVFDQSKITRVELTAKTGPIEFGRNAQNEWQIVKPKPQRADNGKVEELIQKLGDARMDTSAPPEEAPKAASNFAIRYTRRNGLRHRRERHIHA